MRQRYLLDPDKIPLNPGTTVVVQKKMQLDSGFIIKSGITGQVKSIDTQGTIMQVTIETPGGQTYTIPRSNLTVQKQRVLERAAFRMHGWNKFKSRVVLATVVGSHAWGLTNKHSDQDVKGVFCWTFDAYAGFYQSCREINDPDHDAQYWEVQKLVEQALNADPNALEALWSPLIVAMTPAGELLKNRRHLFTSTAILGTFGRYATSQFKKIQSRLNCDDESRLARPKNAYNLIRLLHSAIHWIKEGEPLIKVKGAIRNELLAIKASEVPIETVLQRGRELALELEETHAQHQNLPPEPDFQGAQALLIEIRRMCEQRPLTMLTSAPKLPAQISHDEPKYEPLNAVKQPDPTSLKHILFDLDDTLYNCYEQCVLPAHQEAAEAMIKAGLKADLMTVANLRLRVRSEFPESQLEAVVCALVGEPCTEAIINAGQSAFFARDPGELTLFEGVDKLLTHLKARHCSVSIVTRGDPKTQHTKIERLGLKKWADHIVVVSGAETKKSAIQSIVESFNPSECLVVGDNARDEIAAARELGLYSCWIAGQGEFPKAPDFATWNLSQTAELNTWFQQN